MKVLKVALFDLKRCNFMTPKCHSFLDIIYKYSSLNVFGTPTCNRDKHTNILKTNDQAFFFSRRVRKSAGGKGMKDCLISVVNILNIQIQPGLKAKLWLIIRVNKKKLNRVMLNGNDNENGFKTNRSNQQKKKTNCTCSTLFLSFPCRCFAPLQRCFVRRKCQTSQLHIIFMEELS